MKRTKLINFFLVFVLLILIVFTGYSLNLLTNYVYSLFSNIQDFIIDKDFYSQKIALFSIFSILGGLAIVADIIAMVLIKKENAPNFKQKRIKKLEAELERLKKDE